MFVAAAMRYLSERELEVRHGAEHRCEAEMSFWVRLATDVHGREVLHVMERFPTFDSYDLLCENRYFHWYYIRHADGLTQVRTDDASERVQILERVQPGAITSSQERILRCEGWMT